MKGSKELIKFYEKREKALGEKATKLNMFLEGFAEGSNSTKEHIIEKACEWWKFEMRTSCPDDVYESWCQHKLEEFKRDMEE